jgi:methylated-DNA-[protein]-cysteine S-methyltransferase
MPRKKMRKKRSKSTDLSYDIFESPLGRLYLVFQGHSLCALTFQKPDSMLRRDKSPHGVLKELTEYFESGRDHFSLKITFTHGTAFDQRVWLALRKIPYGETRTYKWLAEKIGKPGAGRAVGQSLSRNPLPIILPCHRIIESDGSIGGYSAGINIKRRLLDLEYYMKLEKQSR